MHAAKFISHARLPYFYWGRNNKPLSHRAIAIIYLNGFSFVELSLGDIPIDPWFMMRYKFDFSWEPHEMLWNKFSILFSYIRKQSLLIFTHQQNFEFL